MLQRTLPNRKRKTLFFLKILGIRKYSYVNGFTSHLFRFWKDPQGELDDCLEILLPKIVDGQIMFSGFGLDRYREGAYKVFTLSLVIIEISWGRKTNIEGA